MISTLLLAALICSGLAVQQFSSGKTAIQDIIVESFEGTAVISSDNIAAGQVNQDHLGLQDPVYESDAVTKAYLEEAILKSKEPTFYAYKLISVTGELSIAVPPEIVSTGQEFFVLFTPNLVTPKSVTVTQLPTVDLTAGQTIHARVHSSNTALQTDVTVYVIFVVPGTDRSLCHFEQLESTEQSIDLPKPYRYNTPTFLTAITDSPPLLSRITLGAAHNLAEFYTFTGVITSTKDITLAFIGAANSTRYESSILGSFEADTVSNHGVVYFSRTYDVPPAVVLAAWDVNRSGVTTCVVSNVTTTQFSYHCYVYANDRAAFDRLPYLVVPL